MSSRRLTLTTFPSCELPAELAELIGGKGGRGRRDEGRRCLDDRLKLTLSDLSDATAPEFEKRKALAEEIRKACLTAGFFYGESGLEAGTAML